MFYTQFFIHIAINLNIYSFSLNIYMVSLSFYFFIVGTQIFYLIDESEEVGKGANSVVSMLHHHFHYKSYGETAAKLHMDNCAGQNKNNIVWTMENTKQPTQRNKI
ncbi:hypothetical protein KUTeg_018185 [Tegillarca granosa]|uniref:Uncharacterized protein n=1 Tax=Tegillarca granosa TaxID=220873 RepID=A0ABQ9ELY3_TEGGR|nr:hypothetical protein KUTeg_018185 [Tegillarca granosa]